MEWKSFFFPSHWQPCGRGIPHLDSDALKSEGDPCSQLFIGYDNRKTCENTNMQTCRDYAQQMAPTVRQEDDLLIWSYNGRHDPWLYTNCKLLGMVERGGSYGKGSNLVSLKIKAAARCGDPKMLANAMKSYPRAKDVNNKDCALEGSELFGSTKHKFNLPPNVDYDSHQPDKVNYFIPRPNTHATRQCIEESLSSAVHGVSHTIC